MNKFNSNTIFGLAIMAFFLVGLFFLAKGLFTILSYITPVLLIIALILDYEVVLNYGKMIIRQLKENMGMGILIILITVLAYPFVAAYLTMKAVISNRLKRIEKEMQGKAGNYYTEYEEIPDDDMTLDLPPRQVKEKPPRAEDTTEDYDKFFN